MHIQHYDRYDFNENEYLWRYIDIYKLLDFLNTKAIHFTQFGKLDDPMEGIDYELSVTNQLIKGTPDYQGLDKDFDENTKQSILQTKESAQAYYTSQKESLENNFYVSCWYIGVKESLAMWNLYSNKNGVSIRVKAKKLKEIILKNAQEFKDSTEEPFTIFYYGKVSYLPLTPFESNSEKWKDFQPYSSNDQGFIKDESYTHENEYRFISIIEGSRETYPNYFKLLVNNFKI